MCVAQVALLDELVVEGTHREHGDAIATGHRFLHVGHVVLLQDVGVVEDDRVSVVVERLDRPIQVPSMGSSQLDRIELVLPIGEHEVVVGREDTTIKGKRQDVHGDGRLAGTGETAHHVEVHEKYLLHRQTPDEKEKQKPSGYCSYYTGLCNKPKIDTPKTAVLSF
jgi:hypothetical protein